MSSTTINVRFELAPDSFLMECPEDFYDLNRLKDLLSGETEYKNFRLATSAGSLRLSGEGTPGMEQKLRSFFATYHGFPDYPVFKAGDVVKRMGSGILTLIKGLHEDGQVVSSNKIPDPILFGNGYPAHKRVP